MKKVYIEWYDAYTLDSWQPIEEAKDMMNHKYIVKTIGWLMSENEGYVFICHSLTSVQLMGALHIPRECIIKIEEL